MPGILIQWMLRILVLNDNSNNNNDNFVPISCLHDKESVVNEKNYGYLFFCEKKHFYFHTGHVFFLFSFKNCINCSSN